jgi:hypothetical protein
LNFLKSCISSAIKAIVGLVVIFFLLVVASAVIGDKKDKTPPTIGYLKSGASFEYEREWYQYKTPLKVKIYWSDKVMSAKGKELIQFEFLEGKYAGKWGYATEESFSR